MKVWKCVSLVMVLVASATGMAEAAPPGQVCTGYHGTFPVFIPHSEPARWRESQTVEFWYDTCSLGLHTDEWWSVYHAATAWDDLISIVDGYYNKSSQDCTVTSGDGYSDAAIVPRSTIDTLAGTTENGGGVTIVTYDCIGFHQDPYEPAITEADVYVADDFDFSDPSATEVYTGLGRQAFFHEFGHGFGFAHEYTNYFSVMEGEAGNGYPTVAGTPSNILFPNDTNGLNQLYGLDSSLPNLVVSAHKLVGHAECDKLCLPELYQDETINVCPGDSLTAQFYIGNPGKSATGTFNIRLYANTNPTSSGGDILNTYPSVSSRAAFTEGAYNLNFTVPSGLETGRNYINVVVDYNDSTSEVSNQDNWTVSGLELWVVPEWTCS